MLVLTRKKEESIIIGDEIEIVITQILEDRVKIAIKAPRDMKIFRKELIEAIEDENIKSTMVQKDEIEALQSIIIKKSK